VNARKIILAGVAVISLLSSIAVSFAAAPPPVPALPDSERRTSYSISSSQCNCALNFQLYGDSNDFQSWVEVWINGVNVAYNDPTFGWTITSPSGPLANLPRPITDAVLTFTNAQTGVIQIVGARRPRRASQFSESAGVSARNLNQVITDIVAMLREAWDKINDVTGRGVFAPPGETLATLPPLANRAGMGACFDSNGNLAPCVGSPSGSFTAGSGITFTGSGPTTISTPTYQAGNGIAFTGSNPTVISAGAASNGSLLLPSRAAAALLDLHASGAVTTAGYAAPGDGGGATFQNVSTGIMSVTVTSPGSGCTNFGWTTIPLVGGAGTGATASFTVSGGVVTGAVTINSRGVGYAVGNTFTQGGTFPCTTNPVFTVATVGNAPFIDSRILAATVAGGSGYTNGNYFAVQLAGGTGTHAYGSFTVSGGVVTNVSFSPVSRGSAYSVGDVLTVGSQLGAGTGFSLTVTSVSTPLGSFTDSVGTHFQIVADQGNVANTRQFGAVMNYNRNSGDGTATDDGPATQAALNFVGSGAFFLDNGGYNGGTVIVSKGSGKVCGGLIVPQSVILTGLAQNSASLKQCESDTSTAHFITLGDPNNHQSSFFESIKNITLVGNATGTSTTAMVYSNSQQQAIAVENVSIYPNTRACVYTEIGWGGDANFHISNLFCVMGASTPFGISLNYPGAVQTIDGHSQFAASANPAGPGVLIQNNSGGINVIREFYCETIPSCISINDTAGAAMTYIENSESGPGVTNFITRAGTSVANRLKTSMVRSNAGTNTVNNAGTATTGAILADTLF
jgi:hypothetical protein